MLYKGAVSYKGTVYPGEHEGIVDQQLWDRVNQQLGLKRSSPTGRRHQKQAALLSKLLYCGECGAPMLSGHTSSHGQRYRYYFCPIAQRSSRKECGQRQVSALDLEPSLIRQLEPILGADLSRPILEQAVERVVYEGAMRRVLIQLRDGTRSEYRLPEPIGRGAPGSRSQAGRVPRVSRLMALAIKMERLMHEGCIRSYRDWAELGQISRPRLSQIMRLADLAPTIQEELCSCQRHGWEPTDSPKKLFVRWLRS